MEMLHIDKNLSGDLKSKLIDNAESLQFKIHPNSPFPFQSNSKKVYYAECIKLQHVKQLQ